MNRSEAFKLLELDPSSSEEEIRKKFKKLAAKYHPDVNKEPDAEGKFKQINEAVAVLTEKKEQQKVPFNPFGSGFHTGFGSMHEEVAFPILAIPVKLTFFESVLGCKKSVLLRRYLKCEGCDGQGRQATSDNCQNCNGQGKIIQNVSNGSNYHTTFVQPCLHCSGIGKKSNVCIICNGKCALLSEKTFEVGIPGGVGDGQTIRLPAGGHFHKMQMFWAYDDAYLTVQVEKHPTMRMEGNDVISTVNLTLEEAILGTKKTLETCHGSKEVEIPKLSRHSDRVVLEKSGVVNHNLIGNHVFVLDVQYPENIEELVKGK